MSHHHKSSHCRSSCTTVQKPVIAGICGTATLANLSDQAPLTLPVCSGVSTMMPGVRLVFGNLLFQFGTVTGNPGADSGFTVCRPGSGSIYGLILFSSPAATCPVRVDVFFVAAGTMTEQFVGSSVLSTGTSAIVPQAVQLSLNFSVSVPGRFIFRACTSGTATCMNTPLAGSQVTLTETTCCV